MLNIKEINNKLNKIGMLSIEKYNGLNKKYDIVDKDGYKYYINLYSIINHNKYPWKFHKSNPYSIENIKNFIKINNINVELLSNEYINNTTNLKFKCKCGKIFYRTLMKFKDSFYCNNCILKQRSTQENIIIEKIKTLGYIFDKYYGNRIAEFHDVNGYKYKREIQQNFKGKFNKFDKRNPFTIENITNYIKLNNIKTKLISNNYLGNNIRMQWECECKNIFFATWNEFLQGRIKCHNCILKQNKLLKNEDNKKYIIKLGYTPLFEYIDNYGNEKINIKDNDGFLYSCWLNDIKQGKVPNKFDKSNIYTIENINLYLEKNERSDYKCISNFSEYNGNNSCLRFIHIPCGIEFNATLIGMQGKMSRSSNNNRYYTQCPNCKKHKIESNHALILKQIFLHELNGTIVEDKSCINPKTKRPLPTDIVNHNLKIAIEIQSAMHDKESQKIKDKIKKDYWINNGYDFFTVDIRDYNILEMCNIFFPYLKEIPKYVDYNFSNCIDFKQVQNYLNNGYSITEISKIMDIKSGSIHGLINRKVITLPNNYYKDVLKRRPIVRLDKNCKYISKFDTVSEANRNGFKSGTVNRVLKGKQKYAYNSIWMYEDNYLSGNYSIPG